MLRITVIGGTGYAGSHIVREASSRGHVVTVFTRSAPSEGEAGVVYEPGSVLDATMKSRAVEDADVVVSAISPRGELAGKTASALRDVALLTREAGVRFGVVGGAGSLLVGGGTLKVSDTDDFPAAFKAEADEMEMVLQDLQNSEADLDWFYLSPAAGFGAWAPGDARGTYRVGDDQLLVDDAGHSFISGADFAKAFVDEIESPRHSRRRFTVAY